jgi:hypothetical protein
MELLRRNEVQVPPWQPGTNLGVHRESCGLVEGAVAYIMQRRELRAEA